jgi:hypothetical protein
MRPVDWYLASRQDEEFFRTLGDIFPVVKKIKV